LDRRLRSSRSRAELHVHGFELRSFGCLARSQSLYRLRYRGSWSNSMQDLFRAFMYEDNMVWQNWQRCKSQVWDVNRRPEEFLSKNPWSFVCFVSCVCSSNSLMTTYVEATYYIVYRACVAELLYLWW
jgi:hypothetical protein